MHSFAELAVYLSDSPFCLTTVDTIFREREFADFISYFKHSSYDGCMAVTDYIDDEKPLYVGTDAMLRITGFHDKIWEIVIFRAVFTVCAPRLYRPCIVV